MIFYLNCSRDFSDKRNDKKFDSDLSQSYLMVRVYKYKTFAMRKILTNNRDQFGNGRKEQKGAIASESKVLEHSKEEKEYPEIK